MCEPLSFPPISHPAMQIHLNGQPREVPASMTVAQLLESLHMPAVGVAVELNQEVVPKSEHAQRTLSEGDAVEVVSLVGGG